MVLETARGSVVRADYRRRNAAEPSRMVWEQEVEGTPFERILREYVLELELGAAGDRTELTLTAQQRLRGLSRLGSPMVRRGTGRMLADALAGVERALGEGARR
jgi:thymidylate kinase